MKLVFVQSLPLELQAQRKIFDLNLKEARRIKLPKDRIAAANNL